MRGMKIEPIEGGAYRLTKSRSKITMQDIVDFMHEPEQLQRFEGALVVTLFRIRDGMDPGWDDEESAGDAQAIYIIDDDNPRCPVCGLEKPRQYAPDGTRLY